MNEYNVNLYLAHGGPGSGRYPWGSGDRPYQRLEGRNRGKITPKPKTSGISGYIRARKETLGEAKREKARKQLLKKRSEEEMREKMLEADKERVLKSGTATEVLRYQGRLTNQELQNAYTRLNLESQLNRLSENEIKSSLDKLDKIMKTIKTGNEWAKIGTDSYNSLAAIYNATPAGRENPLTLIKRGN